MYFIINLNVFFIRLCPYICMWPSAHDCTRIALVTNACTRVVYFLHMYHACDVLFLLLYIMRGRPFVVVSLRALYLASGPYLASGSY